ncbi:LacI family DNA-binding transcriptional regulator [Pseudokineococcus sp. 5B2Z-1]|uniref:LacI family DNA-binding transcriptional regulator n=1 Tax=Pseudokineococcus sp. 5B2Z-1 TaxID=3132744 RepID=UPI0030A30626
MRDVARRARVSSKTVSNVVNRRPHVHESTRARVEQAISELGYRPNLSARGLRSGRTGVVGLVLPDLRTPAAAALADAVLTAAQEHDLAVVVSRTGTDPGRLAGVLVGEPHRTDGLLLAAELLGAPERALLDEVDHPVVLLGRADVVVAVDQVATADAEAAAAAARHLLDAGRRRVAVVGAPADGSTGRGGASARVVGSRRALEDAGAPVDPRLVVPARAGDPRAGAAAVAALLSAGTPVDAVLALDDALAVGALHALAEGGLRVPDDVAVMGIGDLAPGWSRPALSSVDLGLDDVARTAVAMLLERVGGAGPGQLPPRRHEAPFRVVVRGSTGGPAGG